MSDQSPPLTNFPPPPPLSTAPPLPPPPPLPAVKKTRVFKVAQDLTEPDVPVPLVEPVVEPIVEPVVEPVVAVTEPVPVVEPEPLDFDREVEMWRGLELPPIVAKTEEKEDDMPPLIPVSRPHDMPPLEDCGDDIDDEMPPLEDGHNDVNDTLPLGDSDDNHADDEGEHPQVDEQEQEQEQEDEEPKLQIEEDCQFLHDDSKTIDGELESFSQRIYSAFQNVNNIIFTAFTGAVIGFILVNAFDNRIINNLNEL